MFGDSLPACAIGLNEEKKNRPPGAHGATTMNKDTLDYGFPVVTPWEFQRMMEQAMAKASPFKPDNSVNLEVGLMSGESRWSAMNDFGEILADACKTASPRAVGLCLAEALLFHRLDGLPRLAADFAVGHLTDALIGLIAETETEVDDIVSPTTVRAMYGIGPDRGGGKHTDDDL